MNKNIQTFKKGDAVKYIDDEGEVVYGVISFPCEGSDSIVTVEVIDYLEREKRYIIDHDHVSPLKLEKVETDINDGEGPNPELLYTMQRIIAEGYTSLSELSYFMG